MLYSDEDFISFEVAKLAAEKGFSMGSERYYDNNGGCVTLELNEIKENRIALYINGWGENLYEACTQSALEKWLNSKGIYIEKLYTNKGNSLIINYRIVKRMNCLFGKYFYSELSHEYINLTDMLDDALYECLELV